jgi:hypothetical protein
MSKHIKSAQKLRMEIAEKAAKMVAVEGVADYHSAKQKAAIQLGLTPNNNLPTNKEVEQALIHYQNLFLADTQAGQLKNLRLQAIQAMKLLCQFNPLLVGPVASGTATGFSEITLHLYFDQVEQVGLFLTEKGIPNTLCEKHIRINAIQTIIYPAYRFIADQTSIVLVIFPEKDKNQSPLSSIDNKAMKMVGMQELMKMVEHGSDSTHY